MTDRIFECPCLAARDLGDKALRLQIIGMADTVLYRAVVLLEDPTEPEDKVLGRRKRYGIIPCKKSCAPPPKGTLPIYRADAKHDRHPPIRARGEP